MGYYKVVDGKTFDADLFALAERAQTNDPDGKISLETAQKMFDAVIDGGVYSQVEHDTVDYLLNNMSWDSKAKSWFLTELDAWEAMKAVPEHRIVDGKEVDKELYEIAEDAVGTNPDGKIWLADARLMYEAVIDGGIYTSVEWETVRLIKKKMKWQPEALEWFDKELANWQTEQRKFVHMTLEEVAKEHFVKQDVLREEYDRFSRLIDLKAATMESFDNREEIGLIVRLVDGRRVQVKSDLFELHAGHVELKGGVTIPIRAIEKVQI
jgi:hypothetical protein